MIFKLHYWFLTAGACAPGILLGVFIETYTDAKPIEIGALFMAMPFSSLIFRPLLCSFADRYQAHQKFMLWCFFMVALCYSPFVIIPLLGETFYGAHPRICWYFLVASRIFADIAFGGLLSIGDSLAINYSHRVGTNFGTYRIWGTISWIVFGLIIGQINEIWFLPKYVPAFLVLIICCLFNMSLFWLWPSEYFVMVTNTAPKKVSGGKETEGEKKTLEGNLMPRKLVLAHMRTKLLSLIPFYIYFNPKAVACEQRMDVVSEKEADNSKKKKKETIGGISKMAQVRILLLLVKRDIRVILYFLAFILAGFNIMTVNFFFISLSGLCTPEVGCNYSSLAGMLQAAMASAETGVFIYIKEIEKVLGRVNMAGVGFLLMSIKFTFYGTLWTSVSPYYSILSECLHGVVFGVFLTLQVETAHMFANEVEFILPELIEQKVLAEEEEDVEKLKLSLAATMQALMTSACDGLGRGLGALIFGIVIDRYSFETLWLGIGICASFACAITFLISLVDKTMQLDLGLEKRAERVKKLAKLELVSC